LNINNSKITQKCCSLCGRVFYCLHICHLLGPPESKVCYCKECYIKTFGNHKTNNYLPSQTIFDCPREYTKEKLLELVRNPSFKFDWSIKEKDRKVKKIERATL